MCTVSWVHQDDGYHLLCNRDEKLTRRPATLPHVEQVDGVTVIAPRDGDFGGTWIGVNEMGVSVCLLNGIAPVHGCGRRESRGLLVLRLVSARGSFEVCERIWRLDLGGYAPFTVVAIEPGLPAAVIEWDGVEKSIVLNGDLLAPLISSSYRPEAVRAARHREYLRHTGERANVDTLHSFHESHGTEQGPYSPCMHRADAETVSFSRINVTPAGSELFYSPGSPCARRFGVTNRC